MAKLKPYFVEMALRVDVLVMAENEMDAMVVADRDSERLLRLHGGELESEDATELTSLAQLAALDRLLDGDAELFSEDGRRWKLKEVLPEEVRHEDTDTLDLFGSVDK